MVEWNEPFDIAWHAITGVEHRGRWRLRSRPEGCTQVEFRWAYAFPGSGIPGLVTELAASIPVRRQMRRTLKAGRGAELDPPVQLTTGELAWL